MKMILQEMVSESNPKRVVHFAKGLALSWPGRLLLAVAVIISLASMTLSSQADGRNQHGRNDNSRQEGHGLEGSWINTVSPILPPGAPPVEVRTYLTFSAGGASIGSDRTKPFGSPQHGTWVHVQGHEYAMTFVQDLFDQAGTFVGTFKGRTRIQLVASNELIGVASVETSDPSGNVLSVRCARFRAVRIVPEPLAAPCENLEPEM